MEQQQTAPEQQQARHLKRIDFATGQFTANGKKYIIEDRMCIDRWIMKDELEVELQFGRTPAEMFQSWHDVYDYANGMRFSDIVVCAYNNMRAIEKFTEREPYVLRMAALFINEENEDRTIISNDMISAKIVDWRAEGLDMGDFFRFVANIIPQFIENYKKTTAEFSPTGAE